METITKADLENLERRINKVAGTPETPYTDGTANVGNYHLDWAYGGVCLVQMATTEGGTQSVIPGFCPKRELYGKMQAFLAGLQSAA